LRYSPDRALLVEGEPYGFLFSSLVVSFAIQGVKSPLALRRIVVDRTENEGDSQVMSHV
jgi:hypothetical protein